MKNKSETAFKFKRYLVTSVLVVVSVLALVAMFNLWVDPFGAYRAVSSRELDAYRDQMGSRTSKAELVKRADYDVLLLGSSRTEVAIDPLHPAWEGKKVYNIGLAASSMRELQFVLDYAHTVHRPQSVVVFCDFLGLWGPAETNGDFNDSRFNARRSSIEYHIVNLVGLRSLAASVQVIGRWWADNPTSYTPQGRRRHLRFNRTARIQFDKYVRRYLIRVSPLGDYRPDPARLENFREMLRSCRDNGIEVVVVMLPVHAALLETLRAVGLWPTVEDWKRQLVEIVEEERGDLVMPVWDFATYNRYSMEAVPVSSEDSRKLTWFWDPSHCRSRLGDKVLDRVLMSASAVSVSADDFGVLLSSDNIDTHLANIRIAREGYARSFPHEIEWVRQIADQGQSIRRRHALGASN